MKNTLRYISLSVAITAAAVIAMDPKGVPVPTEKAPINAQAVETADLLGLGNEIQQPNAIQPKQQDLTQEPEAHAVSTARKTGSSYFLHLSSWNAMQNPDK